MSILIAATAMLTTFFVGVLVGSGLVTRAQDARGRRQAALQCQLNNQWRLLQENQEAVEEELRWLSKQQTGLVAKGYNTSEEVSVQNRPSPRHPRRPVQ